MRCDATRKFNIAAMTTRTKSSQSSGLIFRKRSSATETEATYPPCS